MPVAVSLVSSSLHTDVVLFLFSFFSQNIGERKSQRWVRKRLVVDMMMTG